MPNPTGGTPSDAAPPREEPAYPPPPPVRAAAEVPPVWAAADAPRVWAPPGPPPPVSAVLADGPARGTAATLVAATGALLLLAAAATFLAVSWDAIGVAGRFAVVGAATAAAIVGGLRLRRSLPAVGAVVFHLGALLVPIDALGAALQFDARPSTTWTAVGATAVVTLPVLAWYGRSRVLAWAAIAGIPVLATGLGLAQLLPAPVIVAIAALLGLALIGSDLVAADGSDDAADDETDRAEDDDTGAGALRAVGPWVTPTLAAVVVAAPLVLAVVSAMTAIAGTRGNPLVTFAMAGWSSTGWTAAAVAGALATGAITTAAVLRRRAEAAATSPLDGPRSATLATGVPVVALLAVASLAIAGDAPRLAVLLAGPLLFVIAEVAAARPDVLLDRITRPVALAGEVLAAWGLPAALVAVIVAPGADADLDIAAAATVLAAGWVVAVVRRGHRDAAGVFAAAAASLTLGGALAAAAPSSGAAVVVLLAAVVASVVGPARDAAAVVASATALVLGLGAVAGAWGAADQLGDPAATAVVTAVVAVVVTLALAARLERHASVGDGPAAATVLLPAVVLASLTVGGVLADWGGGVTANLATVATAFAAALVLDRRPAPADLLRVGAAVLAVLAVPAQGSPSFASAATVLPVSAVVAVVLAVEVVRTGRTRLAVAAAPVVASLAAGGLWWTTGGSRALTGIGLLLASVAAAVAATRPRWRVAAIVLAVTTGIPGFAALAVSPTAVAWGLVVLGVAAATAGVVLRQPVVGHLGAGLATFGVWQLLAIGDVAAIDAWVAAPALWFWVAVQPARRAGRLSSWGADVPPLLLVAVPAVLERATGGSGWHAIAAGALAIVAVVGGGAARHGGPLVVGVGLVVVVVLVETLAAVAAVPTWVWLAVAGLVLVGAAALIERTGGRPVETVKRVRDVVAQRFD